TEELVVLAGAEPERLPVPVVVGTTYATTVANDKYLTCQVLAAANVTVPRFALPSHLGASSPQEVLGSPFLSKPRVSRGGRGVVVHHGHDAVLEDVDGQGP